MIFKIKWKPLLISILIALGVGALSGVLIMGNVQIYETLALPPLAPPKWLFPVVWGILYILMGVSAYLVWISNSFYKGRAMLAYLLQLLVNFLWPIIFFNMQNYLFAFVWLLLLLVLIIVMIVEFYLVDKRAALLQIPYLIWSLFAAYLTFGVYWLNR